MTYSSRSWAPVIFGTSARANVGRQHSSRMVSWTRSTQPLLLGRRARMKRWPAARSFGRCPDGQPPQGSQLRTAAWTGPLAAFRLAVAVEDLQERPDGKISEDGMTKMAAAVDLVVVSPSDLRASDVSVGDE